MTYYNLDVKEGAPELAISGTFKTIKGLADVANVQSAPGLSSLSGVEARRASALPPEAVIKPISVFMTANDCDFNRSTQHFV